MSRVWPWLLALVFTFWVLLPIYLIALSAFAPREAVYAWPKALWPREVSLDTLRFFFGVEGVWRATPSPATPSSGGTCSGSSSS